eukprot:14248973-Alexandrium_andersonii.AAC.1
MDEEIERSKKPIAFSNHPSSDRLFRVAQYKDEWRASDVGSLRAWYMCASDQCGAAARCCAVIPSKAWRRKNPDIAASGQT